jgi:hypothetical protein
MATFNFEEAEKRLQQSAAAPAFNFEEAEKRLQQPNTPPSFNFEEAEQVLMKAPVSRPTPQQIERQQGAALVAPKEDSTMTPYEGGGGAAFGAYRKIKTQKPSDEVEAEKPIAFKELHTNPEYLKQIEDYASVRFGKTGNKQKDETAEDYVNRFARHMRFVNTNELNYFAEQDWLNTSKSEDVVKAGDAYRLFENTSGFLSEGGQNPLRAFAD